MTTISGQLFDNSLEQRGCKKPCVCNYLRIIVDLKIVLFVQMKTLFDGTVSDRFISFLSFLLAFIFFLDVGILISNFVIVDWHDWASFLFFLIKEDINGS